MPPHAGSLCLPLQLFSTLSFRGPMLCGIFCMVLRISWRILSCSYLQSVVLKVPFGNFMNSCTSPLHTHTHTHTHTEAGNGCFGFYGDHSMLKVLVVQNISKPPPCHPLRWYHFLVKSRMYICLYAWFWRLVKMSPAFGQGRFHLTGLGKNGNHSMCTIVSEPQETM
jgi:hypothetical protein